jgi:hypothetical protein
VAAGLVCLAAVADLRESWLLGHGASDAGALVDTSRAKWALLAAGLAVMLVCARSGLAAFVRWVPAALYTHRYSAAIVLPLSLLSLGRGPDLLEQIPEGMFGNRVARPRPSLIPRKPPPGLKLPRPTDSGLR